MRYVAIIIQIVFFTLISCVNKSKVKSDNNKDSIVISNKISHIDLKDSVFVEIDSVIKSPNTINYQILFNFNGKKNKIYEVENQDHSIELRKKYLFKPLGYSCYEINDLPTGLVWNIFYDFKDKSFYISEKYDVKAIGDTLDRKSVNFINLTANVYSIVEKNKSYPIKLEKL